MAAWPISVQLTALIRPSHWFCPRPSPVEMHICICGQWWSGESTPRVEHSTREKNSWQCVFSANAKRSTSAGSNMLNIIFIVWGCSLYSLVTALCLDSISTLQFRWLGMWEYSWVSAVAMNWYGPDDLYLPLLPCSWNKWEWRGMMCVLVTHECLEAIASYFDCFVSTYLLLWHLSRIELYTTRGLLPLGIHKSLERASYLSSKRKRRHKLSNRFEMAACKASPPLRLLPSLSESSLGRGIFLSYTLRASPW